MRVRGYFFRGTSAGASAELRALAVTSAERVDAESSIPTLAESGVAGYDVNNWHGLVGPKGLPRVVAERINKDALRVMQDKDMEEKLRSEGVAPAGGTPEAFLDQLRREIQMWRRVAEQAGIKGEL